MHATAIYPIWALCLLFGALGACLASFLCAVAERVPAHRSINGRSQCICGRQLKAYENIPIVSWCLLRGTSSCCKSPIPVYYVLAEALNALAFALAVVVFASSTPVMITFDVVACLVVLGVGLLRYRRRNPTT